MKTKPSAIILVFITTLLTSTAQILWKYGSNAYTPGLLNLLTNWGIIGGFFVYAAAAVILIISLRGGELSVLYPIIATSFVWINIASPFFFNEQLNIFKWLGVAVIILGITLVGLGGKHD